LVDPDFGCSWLITVLAGWLITILSAHMAGHDFLAGWLIPILAAHMADHDFGYLADHDNGCSYG